MSELLKTHDPLLGDGYSEEDFVFVQQGERLSDKAYKTTSYWRDVWSHFSKNKGALIGFVIIFI